MGCGGPKCLLPPVPSSLLQTPAPLTSLWPCFGRHAMLPLLQPPAPFRALLPCIDISTMPPLPLLLLLLAVGGWDLARWGLPLLLLLAVGGMDLASRGGVPLLLLLLLVSIGGRVLVVVRRWELRMDESSLLLLRRRLHIALGIEVPSPLPVLPKLLRWRRHKLLWLMIPLHLLLLHLLHLVLLLVGRCILMLESRG